MKSMKILAAVILACLMLMGIAGCSSVPARVNNNKDYNIGGASISDTVENIIIDWSSGKVDFVTGSEAGITFSEKAPDDLPEDLQLHWRLEGTTLYIRDSVEHPVIFNFKCGGSDYNKELTVTVPEMMIYSAVNIGVSSAKVNAPVIKAANVTVNSSSGNIKAGCICTSAALSASSGNINAACTAQTITATASSGRISLDSAGKADSIVLSTSSGAIAVNADNVGKLSAETSSGKIDAAVKADVIELHSSSGRINCTALSQPGSCSIGTSSGEVTLYLPSDAGFTAEIDHSSGEFSCDFPVVMQGDDKYVCGDGSAKINISTSSGDSRILFASYDEAAAN